MRDVFHEWMQDRDQFSLPGKGKQRLKGKVNSSTRFQSTADIHMTLYYKLH